MSLLDWSTNGPNGAAKVGATTPCIDCGHDTVLRDPITGSPRHKLCAERALDRAATAYVQAA